MEWATGTLGEDLNQVLSRVQAVEKKLEVWKKGIGDLTSRVVRQENVELTLIEKARQAEDIQAEASAHRSEVFLELPLAPYWCCSSALKERKHEKERERWTWQIEREC